MRPRQESVYLPPSQIYNIKPLGAFSPVKGLCVYFDYFPQLHTWTMPLLLPV